MKRERFKSVLLSGHKEAAFEVPFDPSELWSIPAKPLRPGRRGHPVRGTVNGIGFESSVVARQRRFFVIVEDELRTRAKLQIGKSAEIAIEPGTASVASPIRRQRVSPGAALARVRRVCLSLPETTEKVAWGAPTFRVCDRIFVTFSNNHHGDGRLAITCNAPEGVQDALVAADPVNFFVPPYVGKGGWLGVRLDCGLPASTVAALIEQAHQTTASKLRRTTRKR